MQPITGEVLAKTSKELLRKLETKQITLAEFLRECAYWAVKDGFDELVKKEYPEKPMQIVEYESLDEYAKKKYSWEDVKKSRPRDYDIMQEYFYQCKTVKQANSATLDWLKEMFNNIPADDTLTRAQVQERISIFEPSTMKMFDAQEVYL